MQATKGDKAATVLIKCESYEVQYQDVPTSEMTIICIINWSPIRFKLSPQTGTSVWCSKPNQKHEALGNNSLVLYSQIDTAHSTF